MNIVDAYKDSRFDPSVDEGTDFRHETVLCMPIKNSDSFIIGVIQVKIIYIKVFRKSIQRLNLFFCPFYHCLQLVNKFNDLPFTKNDENFVEAFSIFCGMGINNTNM